MTAATGHLFNVILASLIPAFLAMTGGDRDAARDAAREAIDEYRAKGCTDLITIGQIISHGLASSASATQSMSPDLTEKEKLQHRRAAVSLARSAERNRRAVGIDPPPRSRPKPETTLPRDAKPAGHGTSGTSEAMARPPDPAAPAPSVPDAADPDLSGLTQAELQAVALAKSANDLLDSAAALPEKDQVLVRIQAGAIITAAKSVLTGQPIAAEDYIPGAQR